MKSNALFNTLFLIFSFAVIGMASGNIHLADMALTQSTETKSITVSEEEYALNHNLSKAIYQHQI